jgi:hypothetical protein
MRARAVAPFARDPEGSLKIGLRRNLIKDPPGLVGDHALQLGLVRGIGNHSCVQFVLSFARLGGEDVPGECMLPDHLPRPGLFEPFGRTFVGVEFGHENIPGKQEFTTLAREWCVSGLTH